MDCQVLVVGGGHAGCEAAAAACRVGAETMLLSGKLNALGRMSCNPAIGGIAKGHLVREIDALGGIIGEVSDRTAIQYRVLNRSKGFAVWSPRAQCDRKLYSVVMHKTMAEYHHLQLKEGIAGSFRVQSDGTFVVLLESGEEIHAQTLVLSCGTFLNGLLHFGDHAIEGGRIDEPPVKGLTECLVGMGFQAGRLKTGTPPRIDGKSIDYSKVDRQDSDTDPIFFSHNTTEPYLPLKPCWITHTNEAVHDVLRQGLDRSPLYSGKIKGTGPRYCPSIEVKIVRFPDKLRHTIFLEPEGLDTDLYYPNGLATSLPIDIQEEAFRLIPGLENAVISESGYAIEYDFFPPHQLKRTLETKLVPNLYFSGQINGTSGYEEAAAQGLVAGCNAAHNALGDGNIFTLERDQAYIGVLIDDLITRGTDEPYRMFTSRAEFRLKLRLDNADERLSELGNAVGLVDDVRTAEVVAEELTTQDVIRQLNATRTIAPNSGEIVHVSDMLRRPGLELSDFMGDLSEDLQEKIKGMPRSSAFIRHIEALIKYEGYLKRQDSRAADLRRNRSRHIPSDFPFESIKGLSGEGREKLVRIRPQDLGEAANIPGLTPADLAIILVHLKRFV